MKFVKILILFSFSSVLWADFINQTPNIIKDTKTNFLWQDNEIVKTKKRDFNSALNYCKELEIDGIKGWELPGFLELFSIVDQKLYNPTLSKKFNNFVNDNYWSSKKFGHGTSTESIVINFKSGAFNRELMSDKFYVRCYKKN